MLHEMAYECVSGCFTSVKAPDISIMMAHTLLEGVLGYPDVEFVTKPARGFVDNATSAAVPIVGTNIAPTITLSVHIVPRHYVCI